MKILTGDETLPTPPTPTNPNLQPEKYQGIAVDSKYVPRKMLLTHVAGYLWVVPMYFSQYVATDDETAAHEVNRPGVYQQYLKINNLEMRVQNPLEASQDDTSKEFSYEGSATLYSTIVPNKGDMFVADIGDGKSGLFTVSSARQNAVLLDTTYTIDYELVSYGNYQRRLEDLLSKVVKEVWYHKDFMGMGKDPFLVSSEHQAVLDLLAQLEVLPREYFETFFNHEFKTFLIPDQDHTTHDPFLTRYVHSTTSLDDSSLHLELKLQNIQDGKNDLRVTLWDAIQRKDSRMVDRITPQMALFSPDKSYQVTSYSSWRLSGIDFLYYHRGAKTINGIELPIYRGLKKSPDSIFNRPIDIFALIPENELYGLPMDVKKPLPLIHPVTMDEFYVLSQAFYTEDWANMSVLEYLITGYLKSTPVAIIPLQKLISQYQYWPALERFYYTPLLIALIKDCFKDIN